MEEQHVKACYQDVDVDDHDEGADRPCEHGNLQRDGNWTRYYEYNWIAAASLCISKLCDERLTNLEFVCGPIFVLLRVNLRSGTRAKGSSNDRIICIQQ